MRASSTKQGKARKSLSKKLRFNVFKRDEFTCQYCGKTPPQVTLEIDHINPVCEGGENNIDNLLTACFDCNRGKGGEKLSIIPDSVQEKADRLREKQDQLKAYERLQKSIARKEEKAIDEIEEVYQEVFPDWQFTDSYRHSIKQNFLPHFTTYELSEFMRTACWATKSDTGSLKYFCGICWKRIKGGMDA